MATNNLQDKLGISLAQAQTSAMDAAAYNAANTSQPGRIQIEGGTSVGSQGTIGSQALSPVTPSTPTAAPTTQKSIAPIAAATPSSPTSPSITINNGGKSGSTPLGSSPIGKTEKVKSESLPEIGTEGITTQQTTGALSFLQIRNKLKAANPNAAPLDIVQQAREQFNAQNNVYSPTSTRPEAQTGIAPLDAELAKLREEKVKKIKDTYKNYTLAQADYQKNAGYYTNFDETNSKFNQVVGDIQNTLTNSKTGTLSDQEIAVIAAKNGVSPEDVKNPLNVYSKLQMTEEGKLTLGVTGRENQIDDMKTENDRQKEDAKIALERNTQQLNYQIEDAQKQLQRNLDWATASGAWSGAARSSGYEQGIQNMKSDTATVVNRINEQIGYMNTDNSKYLTRLNEDFTKNMGRAKESLDLDLKNLKFDSALKLNGLEEKYGKGSKDLLNALDAIQEEFGTKSLDSFNKYLSSVKGVQEITIENINLMDKMNTVSNALKNRRYGELTANNSALLQNTSLSSLMKEVQGGSLDIQNYSDARNLMISSVTNAVTAKGITVSQEDLNVITNLIDNGATPAQVIARLSGGSSIAPTTGLPSLLNMISNAEGTHGNYNGMYGAGGQSDINLTGMTVKEVQDLQKKRIYQDKNGNWVGGAMGKYQVVSGTLNGLIQRGVVKPTDLFDEETQDKIAMSLMGNSWTDYQAGKITPEQFQKKLSNIWASVPDPSTGQSTYASDGTNNVTKGGGEIGEFLRSGGATTTGQEVAFSPYQEAGMLKFQKSGDPKDLLEVGIGKDQYNAYVAQQKAKPIGKSGDFQKSEIEQFKAYNGNSIPEEYKSAEEKTAFLNRMSEWQSQGNLTKIEKDDIEKTRTNLESDVAYKAGLELMPKFKTLTGINQRLKDGSATPQDKQQLINDFAKILDPDSVVREGEYALAGKYAQSKIDAWKQEITNFFTTGGPLSNEAAQMLAEGVDRRFNAIMTEYDGSIDRAMRNVKFKTNRDVPTDALQVEYSPMRSNSGASNSQAIESTVDSIYADIVNF